MLAPWGENEEKWECALSCEFRVVIEGETWIPAFAGMTFPVPSPLTPVPYFRLFRLAKLHLETSDVCSMVCQRPMIAPGERKVSSWPSQPGPLEAGLLL
jgi:hypothetical protein